MDVERRPSLDASCVPASDVRVVAQRCRLALDLASRSATGTASLWVSLPAGAGSLRLHCRQLRIGSVAVNGADARWRCADFVGDAGAAAGAGPDVEAWHAAAEVGAAASGEVEVEVAGAPGAVVERGRGRDGFAATVAQLATHCVVLNYDLPRDPGAGLDFSPARPGPAASVCARGDGERLAAGDCDGARCWTPCVDRVDAAHAWRLEIDAPAPFAVYASGRRDEGAQEIAAFDVDRARARAVGFVVAAFGEERATAKTTKPKLSATRVESLVAATPRALQTLPSPAPHHRSLQTLPSPGPSHRSLPGAFFAGEAPRLTRVDSSWASERPSPRAARAGGPRVACVAEASGDDGDALRDAVLERLGDALQFWRAFFGRGGGDHALVVVDDLRGGNAASFAGLTVLKKSTLARGLDRWCVGHGARDGACLALFRSLCLEDVDLGDVDDGWLLDGAAGYLLTRYVERSRGADEHRRLLRRLAEAALALERDGVDAPLRFSADETETDAALRAHGPRGAPERRVCAAPLALHALEPLVGGRGRLREVLGEVLAPRDPRAGPATTAALLDAGRRAAADGAEARADAFDAWASGWLGRRGCGATLALSFAYNRKRHTIEADFRRTAGAAFSGKVAVRVVERDDAWDYFKRVEADAHRWEFKCHSRGAVARFSPAVNERYRKPAMIAARVAKSGDRDVVEYDDDKPAAATWGRGTVRKPWRAKREVEPTRATGAAAIAAENEKKKRGRESESDEEKPEEKKEEDDDDGDESDGGPDDRERAHWGEDVVEAARAANETPVLWVKVDPDQRLLRPVELAQTDAAWVEQLFGDDDAGAQLAAVEALAAGSRDATAAARLLAARALATCLRGTTTHGEHHVAVRCAAARGLAAWQAREARRAAAGEAASNFAAVQLRAAFDERFRKRGAKGRDGAERAGKLRPGLFPRSDDLSRDALALKTALAAALGSSGGGADDAIARLVEVLRQHVDGDASHLPADLFVAHALAALGLRAGEGAAAAARGAAATQATRYLEWDLLPGARSRSARACVASAALFALGRLDVAAAEDAGGDDGDLRDAALSRPRAFAASTYPEAVRATAVRRALAAGAACGDLRGAVAWALGVLDAPDARGYVRRVGGRALVEAVAGRGVSARPGDALDLPCGLDADEPLLARSPFLAPGPEAAAPRAGDDVAALAPAVLDAARGPAATFDRRWRLALLDAHAALVPPAPGAVGLPPAVARIRDAVAAARAARAAARARAVDAARADLAAERAAPDAGKPAAPKKFVFKAKKRADAAPPAAAAPAPAAAAAAPAAAAAFSLSSLGTPGA